MTTVSQALIDFANKNKPVVPASVKIAAQEFGFDPNSLNWLSRSNSGVFSTIEFYVVLEPVELIFRQVGD